MTALHHLVDAVRKRCRAAAILSWRACVVLVPLLMAPVKGQAAAPACCQQKTDGGSHPTDGGEDQGGAEVGNFVIYNFCNCNC